jgi:D-Tyr-tRNAtyr deacylase
MYATFLERLGQAYKPEKIKGTGGFYSRNASTKLVSDVDGKFGAMMDVSLTNEVRAPSPFSCCRILFSVRDL